MEPAHRRALDAFLVENEDLATLDARLGRLNILEVLGCERVEIRHSNVLAWLLNPSGGHGLGDLFLRRFLARILMDNEDLVSGLTAARAELTSISSVDVRREWRGCDVLVHHAQENWCLLIENKLRSGERIGQLQRYRDSVAAEFSRARVVPVLLTLEGAEPSEEGAEAGWVALSYGEVLDGTERILQQRRAQIPPDALVLLEHWIAALRRLTMTDPELVDLCRAIYRKHRAAIDLIVDYGMVSGVLDACLEYARSIPGLAFEPVVKGTRVWFVPRILAEAQKPVTPGWPRLPVTYPVCWWFEHLRRPGKLQIGLEVGPISDAAFRLAMMRAIKEASFQFNEKEAFREEARYTRIWTKMAMLPKGPDGEVVDDPEAVAAVARKLWEAGSGQTERVVGALRGLKWG